MKPIIIFSVLFSLIMVSAWSQTQSPSKPGIVEEMAVYPGGIEKFREDLLSSLKYPEEAYKKGIEGSVYVEFTVDTLGNIVAPKILRGLGHGCDKAVIDVLLSDKIKKWQPGSQEGKLVPVLFSMPVSFSLEGNKNRLKKKEKRAQRKAARKKNKTQTQ